MNISKKNDLHVLHQLMKTVDQYLSTIDEETKFPRSEPVIEQQVNKLKNSHESYEAQIREIVFSGLDRTTEGKDKLIALYKLANVVAKRSIPFAKPITAIDK